MASFCATEGDAHLGMIPKRQAIPVRIIPRDSDNHPADFRMLTEPYEAVFNDGLALERKVLFGKGGPHPAAYTRRRDHRPTTRLRCFKRHRNRLDTCLRLIHYPISPSPPPSLARGEGVKFPFWRDLFPLPLREGGL